MTRSTPPDPGLFGPDSVTWRVHADASMALAGLRALLLQALHPLAMAGVQQHSGFRSDPWGRLLRTAEYVGTVTYGTVAEAERAGARVRGIHRSLSLVEPGTGRRWPVDDPALLLWVHCTEVESFLTTYRRSGGRISRAEADRYYTEQLRSAALVGLDPAEVPATAEGIAAYFSQVRPQLRLTPAARTAARFVLLPPMARRVELLTPARPAWAALGATAFSLLPRWARRLYRMPGLPSTDLAGALAARGLRTGLLALPPRWREGPRVVAARDRLGLTG